MTEDVEAQRAESYRLELLHVFKNSQEDIDANRLGHLGQGQASRLLRNATNTMLLMAAIVVCFVLVVIVAGTQPVQFWRWILVAVVAVGFAALGLNQSKGLRRAVRDGTVQRLEGPISVKMAGRNGWRLTVDGQSFRLPVQFWHVSSELQYRVYVAAAAKRIVGMELSGQRAAGPSAPPP